MVQTQRSDECFFAPCRIAGWLMLALAAPRATLGLDADTCGSVTMHKQPHVEFSVAAAHEVLDCFRTFEISGEAVFYTIMHVQTMLDNMYSYRDLVRNSTDSEESTGSCKLKVHEVVAPLSVFFLRLEEWARKEFEVPALAALLAEPAKSKKGNSFAFHELIKAGFRDFMDMHTLYKAPYWSYVTGWAYVLGTEMINFSVGRLAQAELAPTVMLHTSKDPNVPGKELKLIEGVEPFRWFVQQAKDKVKGRKSLGARVNRILSIYQLNNFRSGNLEYEMPPLRLSLTFADGSTTTLTLVACFNSETLWNPADAEKDSAENKAWGKVRQWMDETLGPLPVPVPENPALAMAAGLKELLLSAPRKLMSLLPSGSMGASEPAGDREVDEYLAALRLRHTHADSASPKVTFKINRRQWASEPAEHLQAVQPARFEALFPRRTPSVTEQDPRPFPSEIAGLGFGERMVWDAAKPSQFVLAEEDGAEGDAGDAGKNGEEVEPVQVEILYEWPLPARADAQGPPVFSVSWIPNQKMVVLAIRAFEPSGKLEKLPMRWWFERLKIAVEKAVKVGKKERGARLLLDLSDNHGGEVEIVNVVAKMLMPFLATPDQLCDPYTYRMSGLLTEWRDSFGTDRKGLANEIINSWTEEQVNAVVDRLKRLGELEKTGWDIFAPFMNFENLKAFLERLNKADQKQSRELLADIILKPTEEQALPFIFDFFQDAKKGQWYPVGMYDGRDPASGLPFKNKEEPVVNTTTRKWGGVEGTYTGKFLSSCSLAFDMVLNNYEHNWKSIAIVTNGQCGSGCGLLATKLVLKGNATVFSYGGTPTEPMDFAGFEGGSLFPHDDMSAIMLIGGVWGDTLNGQETLIGKRLRSATDGIALRSMMMPLPTNASYTFNFWHSFATELGPDALPIEWYTLISHTNYDIWVPSTKDTPGDSQEMYGIYWAVGDRDWDEVRSKGAGDGRHPDWYTCRFQDEPDHEQHGDYKMSKFVTALWVMLGILLFLGIGFVIYMVIVVRRAKMEQQRAKQEQGEVELGNAW